MRRGLALILVVGVLAVLAVLGSAFAVLSRLERRAASQRVYTTKAWLLARSGVEDAMARVLSGQEPSASGNDYGGEDWNADGVFSLMEQAEEVFQTGTSNVADCPVRHAMRPSFFRKGLTGPWLSRVDGRQRGSSGALSDGDWALQVEDLNGRIHINGGALDALDRDPDGRSELPECGTLTSNLVQDYHDASTEGPNGFLVRLLNNLDLVVTGTTATLGSEIVQGRPQGGYRSVEDLKAVLPPARYARFRRHLTTEAWVDAKVLKPQPTDGRPHRWMDVDDTHRIGTSAATLSGVPTASAIAGTGTSDQPWSQNLVNSNGLEGSVTYPVRWERQYLYAWRQLRIAPPGFEPRAPVAVNQASEEVLASVFLGLKGTYLEVWDGSMGFDGTFSFHNQDWPTYPPVNPISPTYPYPSKDTEDTPWYRTRLDYGKEYGIPGRPWYGPASYNPATTWAGGDGAKPLIQCAPLGRLKETQPISLAQARALAREIRSKPPFRTWRQFHAFVDALPCWEDVDQDGKLDGDPYNVPANGAVGRKVSTREDFNANGVMDNQAFPDGTPGLTFVQKDVLKAMANPNSDLNDFNPDRNLWKEVDKTDVCGLLKASPPWTTDAPGNAYVHTTELAFDGATYAARAWGRMLSPAGKLVAGRSAAGSWSWGILRDTTQADFMRDFNPPGTPADSIFLPPPGPLSYPLTGGQALVSYPEPQTLAGGARLADAAYDGQVGLGFIGPEDPATAWGGTELLRNELFSSLNAPATGDTAASDVRGPYHARLVDAAGRDPGGLLPDGYYSEKDAALKYSWTGVGSGRMVAYWIKPNWFPEASPRAHVLHSTGHGKAQGADCRFGFLYPLHGPHDDLAMSPQGMFFVPARNNYYRDAASLMLGLHGDEPRSLGKSWPVRSLLYGTVHGVYISECVNRRGLEPAPAAHPVGRLEGHRWVHVGGIYMSEGTGGQSPAPAYFPWTDVYHCWVALLGTRASGNGGGWSVYGGGSAATHTADGSANHLRFGEVAGFNGMNYAADATFANVRSTMNCSGMSEPVLAYYAGGGPGVLGRYQKEDGAAFRSPPLPSGFRPARMTWTEIPAELWFDEDNDGWLETRNDDLAGDGKRDVRIEIEVWDASGLRGRFGDPAASNRLPALGAGAYYKAVFVNDWDSTTRLNRPLDVTPFLDDVSFLDARCTIRSWELEETDG